MQSCYRLTAYKTKKKQKGLFDDCTDCCYVLCMNKPKVIERVKTELDAHVPHSKMLLQINEGFKKCSKSHLLKQKTQYDISDAMCTVFKHALSNKYTSILIFEDDFIFNTKYSMTDIENISTFIRNMKPHVTTSVPLCLYLKTCFTHEPTAII